MTRNLAWLGGSLLSALCGTANAAPVPRSSLAQCFSRQNHVAPFAGAILVSQGSKTFVRTVGTVDGTALIRRDTPFRLASVGKTLTRIAIGQLVAQGKIGLDAPVGQYLPDLPPELRSITVEQLIQHRSGVAPLTMFTDESVAVINSARTAHDLLPLVEKEPLHFKPGAREDYSNGGYFILGAVIEAVTKMNYDDYMQNALFRPLGMTATSLTASSATALPMTRMSSPGSAPLRKPQPMTMRSDHGNPAGDAVSTLDDMRKLGDALYGDRLLPLVLKERLFPRGVDMWRIGQAGGAPGTNTYFAAMPDWKTTVVTLSNYDPPGADLMGSVLANLAAGKGCKPMSEADRPSLLQISPRSSPTITH